MVGATLPMLGSRQETFRDLLGGQLGVKSKPVLNYCPTGWDAQGNEQLAGVYRVCLAGHLPM